MATTTALNLSSRDSNVLSALFDAESSPSIAIPVTPSCIPLPQLSDADLFTHLRTREQSILLPLHTADPSPSAISSALAGLDAIIAEHSTYASAYLNRAQTRRLRIPEGCLFSQQCAEATADVLADLDRAIKLAMPLSPTDALSQHQRDVLATACTHRGLLLMKAAEMVKTFDAAGDANSAVLLQLLPVKSSEALEALAGRDFAIGSRYGNKMAQQMSVRTNPYAKMCGTIVKEALRKEMESGGEAERVDGSG